MAQKNCNLVWQNSSKEVIQHKNELSSSSRADVISDIISKSKALESEIIVIKISSNIIEDDALLRNVASNISTLTMSGADVVVVHDYTDMVEKTLHLFGIDKKEFLGPIITDNKTAQIIEMVLSGHINRKIVSALCAAGCNAIGISGKDGNMIEAHKQIAKAKSDTGILEFGFIGEPSIVNPEVLLNLTDNGFLPVITPIAFGPGGSTYLLDVNLTASIIACISTARSLILLEDNLEMNDLGDLSLSELKTASLNELANPSIKNFLDIVATSLKNNTEYVHLVKSADHDAILCSLFSEEYGTKVSLD